MRGPSHPVGGHKRPLAASTPMLYAPFLCPTRGRLFLAWRGVEVSMEYEQTTQYESAVGWSSQPRITTISTTACSTDRPPLQLSVVIFTMKIHLSTKPADNRHCSLFRHHQTSLVFSLRRFWQSEIHRFLSRCSRGSCGVCWSGCPAS